MTSFLIESTGTITLTNGETGFTGTGTAFALKSCAGGLLLSGGAIGAIDTVDSDTAGDLIEGWAGATVEDASFVIIRTTAEATSLTEAQDKLAKLVRLLDAQVYFDFDAAGDAIGERDAYDDEAAKFRFVLLPADGETGPGTLYTKLSATSGDWSGGVSITAGPQGEPGSAKIVGTSSTSLEIGPGTKTFTIAQTNRGWGLGARLRASSAANVNNWMEGKVTSYSGTALELSVDLGGGSGTFDDWTINIAGAKGTDGTDGDDGDPGADGYSPGFRLAFSTTTADADPGNGTFRADNATFGSITKLRIDDLDATGANIETWLQTLDDALNANNRGYLRFEKATDPTVYMEFAVTADLTDKTGYWEVPAGPIAGALPSDGTVMVATFRRSGDGGTGDVAGPDGGVVDSEVALYDDATGKLLKGSGIVYPAGTLAFAGSFIFTPGGDGVVSFYRYDVTAAQNPRTATIDSISGQEITLTTAIAGQFFHDSLAMNGVSLVRIWNTTLSADGHPAWIEAYVDSDTIRVRAADDISSWAAGHTIQIGDPTTITPGRFITLDISPMLTTLFGAPFRQKGIIVKSTLIGGTQGDSIAGAPDGTGGAAVVGAIVSTTGATVGGSGILIPTTELSPISNSNLVRIRETFATTAGVRLFSSLAVFA